ncbi:helix-turn-helix transcriptional regulator [Undibacterium sp. RuRC25W]|uniref:helix-turn-helix transcriptional regulator n=1 Tax=Undibacterium sp. RuRC25W TaxID=3413047 RepID=UPI003BF1E6B9
MQQKTSPRLLRLNSVLQRTPISKSEIYRRVRAGTFPAPIRLGARAVAWLESDIDQYIQKLAQESAK